MYCYGCNEHIFGEIYNVESGEALKNLNLAEFKRDCGWHIKSMEARLDIILCYFCIEKVKIDGKL
jgi:hypothetical protein